MSSIEPPVVEPGNFFVRLFFIIVYMIILSVVRFLLWGVLLVQMVLHLFGAGPSPRAQKLGQTIAEYVYRIWLYLSYNTDDKPFPFNRRKDES